MLKETSYNFLIVSSSEKFNLSTTKFLISSFYTSSTPDIATNLNQANRLLLERNYDIVIINSPVGDQNAINFSLSISDSYQIGILLLVNSYEYTEAFDKTNEYGILTLSKPASLDIFAQTLQLLCSMVEKMHKIRSKSKNELTFKEKMEEIKYSNEAKLLLINKKGFTEEQAHKFIEKKAMDKRVPKLYIAKEIILKLR